MILRDEGASLALGARLAVMARVGDAIALSGPLGAGKTSIARGLLAALGLAGEAGELANKVKKVYRDDAGILTTQARWKLADELGDVLWYVAAVATEIGIDLDAIANLNLNKLAARKTNDTLHGNGDAR